MTIEEIRANAPEGTTHYRIQKVQRYRQAHFYKKIDDAYLWYSFTGDWEKAKIVVRLKPLHP